MASYFININHSGEDGKVERFSIDREIDENTHEGESRDVTAECLLENYAEAYPSAMVSLIETA